MRKSLCRSGLALLAIALPPFFSGCALDPVDKKPETAAPENWNAGKGDAKAVVSGTWWREFGDTALSAAVDKALANSPDLDAAAARVRAARAAAGFADSGFWPTLGLDGGYQRAHYTDSQLSSSVAGHTTGNYDVGGAVAYEVDLWGRVGNAAAAADAEYRASHAALERARQLVAGEIVKLWFDAGQAKVERVIVARELAAREEAYELMKARDEAGMIAEDDVERAALDAAQSKVDLNKLDRRIATLRNALVAATGAPDVPEPSDKLPEKIPVTPLTVPSDMLRNRPDIAVADLRLDAALLGEGVARANYYPDVTLSAVGGFSAINAGDFLSRGSTFWSFGPTVSLPIFTGGKNDAELEAARARYDAAVAAYRRSVLDAFRETEDALVAVDRLADEEKYAAAVSVSAEKVHAFSQARFDEGLSSNLRVIIAERDALTARRDAVRVRFDRLRAAAGLALTLGGGWRRDAGIARSQDAFEKRLEDRDKATAK